MQISQGSDSKDQNLTSPPLHTCFCLIVKEGSHPDPTQPTLDTCQVHADWPLARGYTGQSAQFHQKPSSQIPSALSSSVELKPKGGKSCIELGAWVWSRQKKTPRMKMRMHELFSDNGDESLISRSTSKTTIAE